jgi:hypothetical protein
VIYELGRVVRVTLLLTDPTTGQYTNAAGVAVDLTPPTGADVTPAVTNPSTGSYYADLPASEAGAWRYRWRDGANATLDEGTFLVDAAGSEAAWGPSLDQVAAHVPSRTIELGNLSGTYAQTFTGLTSPTAEQVEDYVRQAVAWVTSHTGTVDAALYGTAQSVASMWAAAQVELAQPADTRDMARYAALLAQAGTMLTTLVAANEAATGTPATGTDVDSAYAFPEAPVWGDRLVL